MKDSDATHKVTAAARVPWNKGKLIGAKSPLRPSHVWSIRAKLQIAGRSRDLAGNGHPPALDGLASVAAQAAGRREGFSAVRGRREERIGSQHPLTGYYTLTH
jgi:hypothetical protein